MKKQGFQRGKVLIFIPFEHRCYDVCSVLQLSLVIGGKTKTLTEAKCQMAMPIVLCDCSLFSCAEPLYEKASLLLILMALVTDRGLHF